MIRSALEHGGDCFDDGFVATPRRSSAPFGCFVGLQLRHALPYVLLILLAIGGPVLRAAQSLPARLYEVTVETGMPHLEENLRYTITRETRCLTQQDLAAAFPVLKDVTLKSCRLDHESRTDDTVSYRLSCKGGHGTTGGAQWRLGERQITGTLNVKLGGKNMTFYQRVSAKPLGECTSAAR